MTLLDDLFFWIYYQVRALWRRTPRGHRKLVESIERTLGGRK